LAFFLNPTAVGYYKTAKAVMNLMLLPITPFISTTYPELNKTIAQKAWGQLRSLLKRLTWMTLLWNSFIIIVLAIFGAWLIPLVYGAEFGPSYPAALILLFGFGVANILYWNRNLLLSLGHPNFALGVIAIVGALKIGLSFLLVPRYGYLMQAALLSAFLAVSVLAITWRGLVLVKQQSALPGSP
jgi:O-antigen/teichoic acid export membrane protein